MNRLLLPLVLMAISSLITPVYSAGTIRVVDVTLSSDCTASNYNEATRDCTGSYSNAYSTIQEAVDLMVPGDTTYLRGGTYPTTERIDLQLTKKSGSAGAYMTFSGFPGDSKPVLQYSEGAGLYGNIKARGNRGWFIFQDLVLDGANLGNGTYWAIRDGNHDIIVRRVEVKNTFGNGIYFDNVNNITVEDSYFHDSRSDCVVGNRWHGFYIHHGTNVTLQRNKVEAYHGIGFQLFPGPWDGVKIKDSVFYNNNHCVTVNNGGAVLQANSGNIANVEISGNVIAHNGYPLGGQPGGAGGGMRIMVGNGYNFSNVVVDHNTIVDNTYNPDACTNTVTCVDHERGNAISILSGVSGITFKNNIVTSNSDASVVNYGSGLTFVNHACKSGESCGSTGKVTVTDALSCIVSLVTPDYRLKQGANPCRDAGATSTARPAPVTSPDIGAYEQPIVSSASVVSGYIEVVINDMTPGVLPTAGLTGFSVACVGCTGSPSVVSANVKSGANNIVQLAIAGLSASGSCTVSLGSTNATDSLFVGGPTSTAQGLNSVSGLSVSGTCQNTTGVGGGVTASWSHFPLNEGSGTVANDDTGNARHGTVSSGVTWVNDSSGTGVSIPTDATYRHVSSTYGSGIDPSTQDFAVCALVTIDSMTANKVVFSSSTNGTGQRWYAGPVLVGGQLQWGIGIKTSGFTTGSEFVVTTNKTLVCLVNDSATDTATLWVNAVKGTVDGKSIKSYTSYTLTGNLLAGNDGTNSVNNGGFTIYEFWVWNTKPSDADIANLYASLTPTSDTSPCLDQTDVQWERPYTDSGLSPRTISANGDGSVSVVPNGGIAFRVQYTCTGTAGSNIALRLYYSVNGTDFDLPVPQVLGADNVAVWGTDANTYFNDGVSLGCLNATGLTENSGITIADSTPGPTFTLAQNHCRTDRYVVRFGNVPGASFWFRMKTDAGFDFDNGYTQPIKVNVIPYQANGGS